MIVRSKIVLGLTLCFSVFQAQAQKTVKAYFVVFLVVLLFQINSYAQINEDGIIPPEKCLDVSKFSFKHVASGIYFSPWEDEVKLKEVLGNPQSTEAYYYEMNEKSGWIYWYGKTKFYIMGNKIYSFHIESNNISLAYNGNEIKVGDPISKLSEFYPSAGEFRKGNVIPIFVQFDGQVLDEFFIVEFSRNTVTVIRKYEN